MTGTTVVAVSRGGRTGIAGDGQVTLSGGLIVKQSAVKVRRLYGGKVVVGFAGSVADAVTLFERFEGKLDAFEGNLKRAAVELAKDWRSDKVLRRLEAMMVAADGPGLLILTGSGEVLEPDDGIAAIGSGAGYALAAARAMATHSNLLPEQIATEALRIAASICVYTNCNIVTEVVEG